MSHYTPEATLTPTRLKFTPETVVSNVLIAHSRKVCCEAVPNTWPGSTLVNDSFIHSFIGFIFRQLCPSEYENKKYTPNTRNQKFASKTNLEQMLNDRITLIFITLRLVS